MPQSLAADILTAVTDLSESTMKGLFFVGFGVAILLGTRALDYMSMNARTNQFVMHLPMLMLAIPANVMLLINALLPIVSWDVMEGTVAWDDFIEFSENRVPLEFHG